MASGRGAATLSDAPVSEVAPSAGRRIAFNASVAAAANVVGKVSTLAWTAVAGRELTRQDFGAFNLALSLGLILAAISEWGFDTALVQRVSRDPSRLSDELSACLVWEAGLGAVLFLSCGAVAVLRTHGGDARLALVFVLAATFVDTTGDSIRAAGAAMQRQGKTSAALAVQRLLTAALVVPAIIASKSLLPFSVAFFASTVVGVAFHLRAIRRVGARFRTARIDRASLRAFVRQTSAIGMSGLVLAALFRVDALLVAAFKGEPALASYAAAYKLFDTVLFVAFAINGAVFPVFTRRSDDPDSFALTFRNATAAISAVYFPFAAICLVDPNGILRLLFGNRYALTSHTSLRWLAAAPIVFGVAYLASSALTAIGRTRGLLVAALAATIVNLGLDLVAIPVMGGPGAAMMTTVAYLVQACVLLVLLRRAGYRAAPWRGMGEPAAAGAVAAAVRLALRLPFVLEAAAAGVAYLAVWVALLYWRDRSRLASLRGMLGRTAS